MCVAAASALDWASRVDASRIVLARDVEVGNCGGVAGASARTLADDGSAAAGAINDINASHTFWYHGAAVTVKELAVGVNGTLILLRANFADCAPCVYSRTPRVGSVTGAVCLFPCGYLS